MIIAEIQVAAFSPIDCKTLAHINTMSRNVPGRQHGNYWSWGLDEMRT